MNAMHLSFFLGSVLFSLVQHDGQCCQNYANNWYGPNKHIAALILARGGSKGIPLKNLALYQNKSLIQNTLDVLLEVGDFTSVWVSTDHDKIYNEVSKNSNVNVHWRTKESTTDDASSIFAVQEFLQKHPQIDALALVQCTSPFIKKTYVLEALNKFIYNKKDCVFSATRSFQLRWKKVKNELVSMNLDPKRRPRRQDWEGEFVENGMFYFAQRSILEKEMFQNDRCDVVEIPKYESMEIDSVLDLQIVNSIWYLLI